MTGLNGVLIVLPQIPVTRMTEGRNRAALLVADALLTGWGFGLTALGGLLLQYAGGGAVRGGCALLGTLAAAGHLVPGRRTAAARASVPASAPAPAPGVESPKADGLRVTSA